MYYDVLKLKTCMDSELVFSLKLSIIGLIFAWLFILKLSMNGLVLLSS